MELKLIKMEKEKKEYEDLKLKMQNEIKDKDAKIEELENQLESGKNHKVIDKKNGGTENLYVLPKFTQ